MDKLEKFIVENKSKFDEPRHPERGWNQIEDQLKNKRPHYLTYWKVAAVVFFITTLGLLAARLSQDNSNTVLADTSDRIEHFYISQIGQKMGEYEKLVNEDEREDLFNDLIAFDSAYAELSRSFDEIKNQELAEAMLENLRLRIFILNEQIELVKQGKRSAESYHSS
jgi:hypothetical protein